MTTYGDLEANSPTGKATMPGHVRASLNWNFLRDAYGDKTSTKIMDGSKIVVCKLKQNPMGFSSIAYPVDELHLPFWFKGLPFDDEAMEYLLVDQKIENLLGVLEWNLEEATDINSTFFNIFEFDA